MKTLITILVLSFGCGAFGYMKGPDDRTTFPKTMAEKMAMRAAVKLRYNGTITSASGFLVHDQSLLLTNYHSLFSLINSETKEGAYVQNMPLKKSERVDVNFDNISCDRVYDVCAVDLMKPVSDTVPAKLAKRNTNLDVLFEKNNEVVMAAFGFEVPAATVASYRASGEGIPLEFNPESFKKKVQTCFVKDSEFFSESSVLFTDCDARHGNSGAILGSMVGDAFTVVGIQYGLNYDAENPPSDGRPYHKLLNSTLHRPVNGLVHDLVEEVLRNRK